VLTGKPKLIGLTSQKYRCTQAFAQSHEVLTSAEEAYAFRRIFPLMFLGNGQKWESQEQIKEYRQKLNTHPYVAHTGAESLKTWQHDSGPDCNYECMCVCTHIDPIRIVVLLTLSIMCIYYAQVPLNMACTAQRHTTAGLSIPLLLGTGCIHRSMWWNGSRGSQCQQSHFRQTLHHLRVNLVVPLSHSHSAPFSLIHPTSGSTAGLSEPCQARARK